MRKIDSKKIIDAVAKLCAEANYNLPADVISALQSAAKKEKGVSKDILAEIIKNADIAKKERIPLCQDTGTANFFIKLGKDVKMTGANIYDAVNAGVAKGYGENYLRKSIVSDPLVRKNTGKNIPANVYIDIVKGNKIEIIFFPKGGGSENASALKMLEPAAGWKGVKEFVLQAVAAKGANACPPIVVGVGIGGDFASVSKIAKESLLRKIGSKNPNAQYAAKEKELLQDINKLKIGPMGFGGKTTALAVFINAKPCHIASLPAAVSIQCHSDRRAAVVL